MSIAKCTLSCCNSTDSQGKCGSEARRGKKNAGRYRTLFFFFSCIAAERHTVTSALGSCFQSTCWFTWCEMKQMFNFAGPTHESMDFCYLSVMFCCMFELFWKIYLMKNQKTSKKVGIQLRKTGILQTLWSSFPLEQVCCQCCFECSCCCVPTVRRNDETIVLRKCVIS